MVQDSSCKLLSSALSLYVSILACDEYMTTYLVRACQGREM